MEIRFGFCTVCGNNAHEKVKLIKEVIEWNGFKREMWVCPKCGATKKL